MRNKKIFFLLFHNEVTQTMADPRVSAVNPEYSALKAGIIPIDQQVMIVSN